MVEQGEWFKPEHMKKVMRAGSTITLLIFLAPLVYVGINNGGTFAWGSVALSAVVFGLTFWYISAFYDTVYYRIGEDDVEYRGGVFFKTQTSVPYERITHVDTKQGPLLRFFEAGSLEVQTAGNSGQNGPELVIKSVDDFEGLKETLREKANRQGSEAVKQPEEQEEEQVSESVQELRKIRKILEERL